ALTGAATISNNNCMNSSALQSPFPPPSQVSQEDQMNKSSKLNPDSMPFCPQMLPPQLAQQQALYQQQLIQALQMQSQFHSQFRPINGFPRLPSQLMSQNIQQMQSMHHQIPPNVVGEVTAKSPIDPSIPPPPHRLWNSPNTRPSGSGFQVPQKQQFQSNGPQHPQIPTPYHQQNRTPMNGSNNPNQRQFQRLIPDIPPPLPTQEQLDIMHNQMQKRPIKQLHHHSSKNPNQIAPHQPIEAKHEPENYQHQHQRSDEDRQRALESNQKYESLFKALGEQSGKQRHQEDIESHHLNPQEQADDCPWQRARGSKPNQAQPFHTPNSPEFSPESSNHHIQSQKLPPPPIQERIIPQVPGPCDPEDLVDGVLFSSNYLGSTQLKVDKNSTKTARMMQAQEAMTRVKAPAGESQPSVEVDLFASTSKIKILNAKTQEVIMEHPLRSISYIADIGDILVLIAKRKDVEESELHRPVSDTGKPQQRVVCHVLQSAEAEMMSSALGQCFQLAFQLFLQINGIPPPSETEAVQEIAEVYHDDLVHYSKSENAKEIWIEKKRGESLGVALVESGWGSILPTVILANIQHSSPAERSGKLNIGDQIMSVNGTSLVGLPLSTVHQVIKGVKPERCVRLNMVSCPPVVTVIIKRPDLRHQLGFSVQNGIICSLMRGGIAEKGGVRVGHRIIEINDESVVATQHDKIVRLLVTSVGEIHMKTMPAAMFRLLTGQDQPLYL
ncbi:unnamed protein product, partial [Oikopleura dioica]